MPSDWDLGEFHKSLEKSAKKRQEEIADLTQKLGTPHYFIPSENDSGRSGTGYWAAPGGVVSYQFTPNGKVIPESREEFQAKHILKLYQLMMQHFPNSLVE